MTFGSSAHIKLVTDQGPFGALFLFLENLEFRYRNGIQCVAYRLLIETLLFPLSI